MMAEKSRVLTRVQKRGLKQAASHAVLVAARPVAVRCHDVLEQRRRHGWVVAAVRMDLRSRAEGAPCDVEAARSGAQWAAREQQRKEAVAVAVDRKQQAVAS